MNLVEFFGLVVKPRIVKGKGLLCPLKTGQISESLYVIRDKDVNVFLIKSPSGYIAIDCGYKESKNVSIGLKELNVLPSKIHTVLLTHLDLDHAGGVDKRCSQIFPNAKVYLSKEEEKYLTKEYFRKKVLGIGVASPIQLNNDYTIFKKDDILCIDGLEIKTIFSPGHTLGHTSFIIDKNMFVGDALVLGDDGGYCFFDFWNTDTKANIKSLRILYKIAKAENVERIITSHTGYSEDIDWSFLHYKTTVNWRKKGFVFRKDAPYNVYEN
ncbi:MAG TPA: MBL fold metallo-hydrolase [Clostridia bacterium]|jgi:glyoxylase-like metal-dependent hydrolase (beta-lactamase superfamily II)|nr:MBL fold metallo-hydrolase [Clostridia bacterium]